MGPQPPGPWPQCGRTEGGRRVSSHRPALVTPRQVEPHCATGVKGQASVSAACPGRAADRDAPPAGDEGAECGAGAGPGTYLPQEPWGRREVARTDTSSERCQVTRKCYLNLLFSLLACHEYVSQQRIVFKAILMLALQRTVVY